MRPSILLATCLILASSSVVAAPRALLPGESRIEFSVKQMGVPVTGEFRRFEAALDFEPSAPERSSARLRIEIGSLTTENEEADAIAVDADWLDKANAPYATFQSTSIRALGTGRYEAEGMLNIRNKSRRLVIRFSASDLPGGKTLISGDFVIKRSEFGIGRGVWNEGGMVAEDIPVRVRLTLAPAANAGASARKGGR